MEKNTYIQIGILLNVIVGGRSGVSNISMGIN